MCIPKVFFARRAENTFMRFKFKTNCEATEAGGREAQFCHPSILHGRICSRTQTCRALYSPILLARAPRKDSLVRARGFIFNRKIHFYKNKSFTHLITLDADVCVSASSEEKADSIAHSRVGKKVFFSFFL
jgi:hypothetical protein